MAKKRFLGYCPECGEKIYYTRDGTVATVIGHEACIISKTTPCEENVLRNYFKGLYNTLIAYYRDEIPAGVRQQMKYNDIKFLLISGGAVCLVVLAVNILSMVFGG